MTAITVRRSPSRALTTVMEPLYRPLSVFDEMERLASDMWKSWTPTVCATHMHPSLDIYEEKDELVMRAELPGICKEDIDISLEGDCLTIKAEKKQEEVHEDATYYSCERCFGSYSRTVTLSFPVNSDKISSTYENGLLEIRLPKAEEAKAKRIEVKVK
ncbi:MAG: Hsp20/alpha crystallin family protein [Dehalococcoidales bacterium]|nr:Hsp20/alpha crystallin family protein [Dehalococcoidales bacterium]